MHGHNGIGVYSAYNDDMVIRLSNGEFLQLHIISTASTIAFDFTSLALLAISTLC